MESGVRCRGIPAIEAFPVAVKSKGAPRVFICSSASAVRSANLPRICTTATQGSANFCGGLHFQQKVYSVALRGPVNFVTVASAESSKCGLRAVATPLEPQSSAGKFLSGILKNHPHIFHVAAAEQLEQLAVDRDGAVARQKKSLGSNESCLHRRIAEMKEHECQIAIEEVMYMLVVYKFSEIEVPMIPRLSECVNNGRLDIWTSKDRELESIYSLDVLELVREHLTTILGWRGKSDVTDNWTTTQICRLQLGRIYAASIMYGYFLKSACLRHHLEVNLSLTQVELPPGHHDIKYPLAESCSHSFGNLAVLGCSTDTVSSLYKGSGRDRRTEKLKKYLMGFDPETLQRCAKLNSQEAANLIEKHSWALFGGDESGSIDSDEVISITFSSFKRLVLEAVAFGSFLWDVESYVGSFYSLKMS